MQINAPSAQQETGFVQICIFICWRNALAYGKVTPVHVQSSARHLAPGFWHLASGSSSSFSSVQLGDWIPLLSQLIYLAMRLQRHYLEWYPVPRVPRVAVPST